MSPRICLSVMIEEGANVDRMIEHASAPKPDLIEFRLDKVHDPNIVRRIAKSKRFPAIGADKSGRGWDASGGLLLEAARAGFEYIDVDLSMPNLKGAVDQIKGLGRETIVSFHDYSGTPNSAELGRVLDSSTHTGADICKIVTTATSSHDNLTVLGFVVEKSRLCRLVSFAMGPLGMPSRILSPLFGAEFTFASLNDASKTADGQPSIDDLRKAWQLFGIR